MFLFAIAVSEGILGCSTSIVSVWKSSSRFARRWGLLPSLIPGTPENQDFVLAVLVHGPFEMVFDVFILGVYFGFVWLVMVLLGILSQFSLPRLQSIKSSASNWKMGSVQFQQWQLVLKICLWLFWNTERNSSLASRMDWWIITKQMLGARISLSILVAEKWGVHCDFVRQAGGWSFAFSMESH